MPLASSGSRQPHDSPPAPPTRLRYEQYRKQEGGVLNASYRVRLAAIEIDPFVGTEIQAGIIKADLDTTFQAMKP